MYKVETVGADLVKELARRRELLGQGTPAVAAADAAVLHVQGGAWLADLARCELCGTGRMVRRPELPRCCGPPAPGQGWQAA